MNIFNQRMKKLVIPLIIILIAVIALLYLFNRPKADTSTSEPQRSFYRLSGKVTLSNGHSIKSGQLVFRTNFSATDKGEYYSEIDSTTGDYYISLPDGGYSIGLITVLGGNYKLISPQGLSVWEDTPETIDFSFE